MVELPAKFLERMKAQLKDEMPAFLSAYNAPAVRALRVNTLKISVKDFLALSPFSTQSVEWAEEGFYITEGKPGKHPFHAAGLYYVQEPSAMCAVPLFDGLDGGGLVLDLCAAPGGKSTQLAQRMAGRGVIIMNEINFERAKILSQNVERMGIKNAVVTCARPDRLAENLAGCLDKILVDAPCSGEGMFKKEINAIPEWSEENVKMCAARQSEILDCAAKMLKSNGQLVYSTCTFSEEEDEGQIQDFLSRHPEFTLKRQEKLYPHKVKGEGHFAALLIKNSGESGYFASLKPEFKDKKQLNTYHTFERETLKKTFENLHLVGTELYSLPEGMPKLSVQTLRAGVRLGEFKGDRFEPSHSLAMCLKSSEVNAIELDAATIEKYLEGQTFECNPDLKGWYAVTYCGYPLGWCKAVGGTAKNHLPKALRTRN